MRLSRRLALLVAIAAIYTVAGKLGLRLGIVNPSASPVWAPTGIALAACLLFGTSVWPAIFAGAVVVNFTTTGLLLPSLGVALGNTLEAVVGAALVNRWANGADAFDSGETAIRFAILAALGATVIAATLGVTSLTLAGLVPITQYRDVWFTWWLGDLAGALIVAPPLILWGINQRTSWTRAHLAEALAAAGITVLVAALSFGGVTLDVTGGHTLGFLAVPPLIWIAVRFGPREATTAVVVVAAIAIWELLRGSGPYNDSLLVLQAFMAVTDVTILVLAATVAERRRTAAQLQQLAITDPLTGLANYRRLITVIERELERAKRVGREFAVVLFDLDGLKKINDHYGHLTGSRALVRLAAAITQNIRTIDTAARLGGDEFALVLPETGAEDARIVAERIRARLADDAEPPATTVSAGVAIYPAGGTTLEHLLGAADQALYGMKRAEGPAPSRAVRDGDRR
ncbi:MAG TPA: MASE1 domain-containing protein [Gemmatimonadales bacterium]|nr:MASE1 domain-containing protein [Gemmatimonadales bacterium]